MSAEIRSDLGRTRGHGTKQLQKYGNLTTENPLPWNDVAKPKFQALKNSMNNTLDKFQNCYERWRQLIQDLDDDEEGKTEEQTLIEWKNKPEYDDMVFDLETAVEEIQANLRFKTNDHSTLQPAEHVVQEEIPSDKNDTVTHVNLPKFNGEYLKWNTFWQRFEHTVHNRRIPKIEKLITLLGLLEGRALEEVEGFQVCEENYETVVDILVNRFGKKQLIIMELQENLRGIETAKSNPESLRTTINTICNMCRQLENLGVDVNNDPMKLDIINKLPPREKDELKWFMISSPQSASIDELIKRMKDMALKAELSSYNQRKVFVETKTHSFQSPPRFTTTNPSSRFISNNNGPSPSRFSSNFTSTNNPANFQPRSNTSSGKSFKCTLCDEPHKASTCSKYVSMEEKVNQLKARNRCTKCMSKLHDTRSCNASIKCNLCNEQHYSFLCRKSDTNVNRSSTFITVEKKQGMLLTKEVIISNPVTNETTEAVVIFDSGSQKSYVSNNIIEQLKLEKIQEEKLHILGFGAKASSYTSSLVRFKVKTIDDCKEVYANSTKRIATTVPVVQSENFDSNCITTVYKTPDILIGMDYFFDFISSFEKSNNDMFIVNSSVGKMICKSIPKQQTTTVTTLAIEPSMLGPELSQIKPENDIEKFWNLEDMGIKDSPKTNEAELLILEKFKSNVKFRNNRYYVSWPIKEEHDELPSNAGLAIGRLKSTMKRLSYDPKLWKDCEKIIDDQVQRGTVEIAPQIPQGKLVHYLAPHAVITPEKTTTKVRMVFDASAKISKCSPSLNNCLIRGPLNMPDLAGILLRIRCAKYMLVGDIEKAFHQVYLNEEDRDAVRFFWVKDPSKPLTKDNLIIYRFVGVPFGVISSPFILWIIILIHLAKLNDQKLREIEENLYVDNLFLLVDDKLEGMKQFKIIREHFLQATMNIREWISNDSEINEKFPEEIRQKNTITKILGLNWNTETDTLQVKLKRNLVSTTWTKRSILKFIASTFDPLGFLSPVTVKGRTFMQKLFKENFSWDELLNENLLNEWKIILKDWNGEIEIPRKYVKNKFSTYKNVQIHTFADASQQAYCAAVFLRIQTDNEIVTPLVFAKTRLQPLKKKLTIPKLEIMGIWLASKITNYVAIQMKLEHCEKYLWTDSLISYYWFQKSPKDVFVANRLKEVLKSNATCFFVPGHMNPADLGTRGISFEELKHADCWWNGPQFLKQDPSNWPKLPKLANDLKLGADLTQTVMMLVATNETEPLQKVDQIREIEIETNLSYKQLKQKVAEKFQQKDARTITVEDLQSVEKSLIAQEQKIFVGPKDEKEFKLAKDSDNLFRVHCRFDHAELINPTPIYLPKNSPLTKLIIQDIHENLHHSGIPHTLSKIRETFWIPSGRETVKKELGKCKDCKYWKSKSFALPQMPSLPSTRVNTTKPFQNVGVDYCGPFKVKGDKEKVWIILLTCFTTRLLHLEPVTSMNSEEFLLSFRRFVARRGAPKYILSDNAKQFKTTSTTLDELWKTSIKSDQTVQYCNEHAITWDFITERAPWKGGLYERLVALVKNALKQAIGRKYISFNEFWTFLNEIEATINSRPLTYVHSKEPFVIRPIDFVSPGIQINLPTVPVDNQNEDETYLPSNSCGGERLAEHYKKTVEYLDKFWNLWNKDYLNFLRERNVNEHKNRRGAVQRHPLLNETVLVYEPDIPRGLWKIATITELIKSADGEIRSAKIEYKDGFSTKRAVNHLYPIEEPLPTTSLIQHEKVTEVVTLFVESASNICIKQNKNEMSLQKNETFGEKPFAKQHSHCEQSSKLSSFFNQTNMSSSSSSKSSSNEKLMVTPVKLTKEEIRQKADQRNKQYRTTFRREKRHKNSIAREALARLEEAKKAVREMELIIKGGQCVSEKRTHEFNSMMKKTGKVVKSYNKKATEVKYLSESWDMAKEEMENCK